MVAVATAKAVRTVTNENGNITLESGAYRLRYTGEIPVIAL